jgi:hypothetical protein
VLGDGEHRPYRLYHRAAREVGQRTLHGRDHLLHTKQMANRALVQVHRRTPVSRSPRKASPPMVVNENLRYILAVQRLPNFGEPCLGELLRITLLRTPMHKCSS